jgi:hypothetical protein
MCKNGNGEECCCCKRKRIKDKADMEFYDAIFIGICMSGIVLGIAMIGIAFWMKFS